MLEEIITLPILFKVWCHKDVHKIMENVGFIKLEQNLKKPVKFYKQDPTTKKLFIYEKGKQQPASREEIKELEYAAV